ncbi:MAG TPA: FecR domain-containing protein [Chitinophaga sp.]|nr:FecR domain-containing protein [Chitinophaga sp.]
MEKHQKDYSQYTKIDFFTDDLFISHVLHPDEENMAYWELIGKNFPGKVPEMEEARFWILALNRQSAYRPSAGKPELWQKIAAEIHAYDRRQLRYIRPMKRAARWIGSAAAIFILGWMLNEYSQQGEKAHHASYGAQQEIVLPDESVVTLNGNSTIRYARTWKSDKPREIWLQGEAYFTVKHVALKNRLQQSDSFRVHVQDLDITVLGTRFNVKNRRTATEISLVEGSLRINQTGTGALLRVLKPGDAFIYDSTSHELKSLERKAVANKAWTNNEIDLDGYTLEDILHILEDTYGYEITLQAPELAQKRLSGTIPAHNAEDILFVLKKVFNLRINQKSNHLTISPNQYP